MRTLTRRRSLALPFAVAPLGRQTKFQPEVAERVLPTDEEVMGRLQSNDSTALEILFDRYARLVFRIAQGVIRDSGEAEDVVQESFLHLYKKSNLFDRNK